MFGTDAGVVEARGNRMHVGGLAVVVRQGRNCSCHAARRACRPKESRSVLRAVAAAAGFDADKPDDLSSISG